MECKRKEMDIILHRRKTCKQFLVSFVEVFVDTSFIISFLGIGFLKTGDKNEMRT